MPARVVRGVPLTRPYVPPARDAVIRIGSPLLAVEVGNTRAKFGWFPPVLLTQSPGSSSPPVPRAVARVPHGGDVADAVRAVLPEDEGDRPETVLAGVDAAAAAAVWNAWPTGLCPPPRMLTPRDLAGRVENVTRTPETTGVDRLLNALAAAALFPDAPAVAVADCGTATTVDRVLPRDRGVDVGAVFAGGAILPGPTLAAAALTDRTALLPAVDLTGGPADGLDTPSAIRRGVLTSHAAGVDRLFSHIREAHPAAACVLTGGAAPLTVPHLQTPDVRVVEHLTLTGLALAARAGTA